MDEAKKVQPELVSIIVNNYNYGRYISRAIDSALQQTYPNIEVIVVDDGSTDNSREILKTYADRVEVILQENGGQAAAFNTGFRKSKGSLIAFLDSDDELVPSAIEMVVKNWQPEFAKFQFPLDIVNIDGERIGLRMPRLLVACGDLLPSFLKTGRYIASPTSGNVFNRRFLDEVLPIPESRWAKTADGYLNNCAPFHGTIGAIQTPLALYRVHGQSMSSIVRNGQLNVKTAEQIMLNGLNEKALIESKAAERNLKVGRGIVVSHWLFLKLKLALEKTAASSENVMAISGSVMKSGGQLIISALTSPELSIQKKLQHSAWALSVVVLPHQLAQKVINLAFETAPTAGVARGLRRI